MAKYFRIQLPPSQLKPVLYALVLGFGSAMAALAIGFPAPFLTGPALVVSLAGVVGVPLFMPNFLRNGVFVVIGMTMGAGVTPETVATAAKWPLSILMLFAGLIVIMIVSARFLRTMFGYDKYTALLSATPGHLSYVLSLSTETKADIPVLSIVQTMRVLTLTLAVPFIVALVYPDLEPRFALEGESITLSGLIIVSSVALCVGLILMKLKMPAALLMGGLIVSAFFHVTEILPGTIPSWLTSPAFILMGILIGTRFNGATWSLLRGALTASLVVTGVALIVSGASALIVGMFIDVPPAHLLIAFAPGGLETMAAMGIMLDANPAFIAAHHVLRIMFLTAIIPIALRFIRD
ncbi:AbrB family transcriptional regulator [Ahrensia marina]|uniref:AbrB family transcriptional regulator n=1 Tax=Ahrensia marina TaxID=1514904 RepID=UPI001364B579|nr:AbrB family transcriptional regulator [Ahrensia marina]